MGASISSVDEPLISDLKDVPECLLRCLVQKRTIDDYDAVLLGASRKLAEKTCAQAVAIFVLAKGGTRIQVRHVFFSSFAHAGSQERRQLFQEKAEQLRQIILPKTQTTAGQVIVKGSPLVLTDATEAREFYEPIGWAPEFIIRSLVAVPLQAGAQVTGCIEVLNKCPDGKAPIPFTPEDQRLLEEAAPWVAKVIERAGDSGAVVNERDTARCIAALAGCAYVNLTHFNADLALLTQIGPEKVRRYSILPLARVSEKSIRAAISNPLDYQRIADFELVTGLKVAEKLVAPEAEINVALKKLFPDSTGMKSAADSLVREYAGDEANLLPVALRREEDEESEEDENSAPIVKLASRIIEDAHLQGASDVHIEPFEDKVLVRYRIDGVCRVKLTLPKNVHRALVSRIKIMSDLDIAEHRLPQDGRVSFRNFSSGHDVDLRVSIAPMAYGESVVLRLLDKTKSTLPLEKLGFSDYNLGLYKQTIQAPYGMILHVGPTGSGKSMTLFAALNAINSPDWKIITAEDPIEYTLAGINQMQMKEDIGLSFSSALRCFLRQDPDIILVGEVRDRETAEIAIEAALTGHLIFSTLHTNDAPSAVTRLIDLEIEPFLISTTLICICAQRLIRRLCVCKKAQKPTSEELELINCSKDPAPMGEVYVPRGCDACDHVGYKGRIGIHELLQITDDIRELILQNGNALQLKAAARTNGMRTLFEDGMEKVKSGISSIAEAVAVAKRDEA